jgi:molybdate transport system substrate-binding protein
MRFPPSIALALTSALLIAACSGDAGATTRRTPLATSAGVPSTQPVEVTIYAAASLRGLLEAARQAYEATNPGAKIVLSTDSSAALRIKIEQGAPADLFLSADTLNPQLLVDRGFADGDAVVFAGNELAIVVPLDNRAGFLSPMDLASDGMRIIAAGDEVPITKYADALIANLAGEPGYPTTFAAGYAANVVSREQNVGAVVAKIELGQGDAAIVYRTDAIASTMVDTVDIPAGANVAVSYAAVVPTGAAQAPAARAFLDWLAGPAGRSILQTFGFLRPTGS